MTVLDIQFEVDAIAESAFRAVADPSGWVTVADRIRALCEGPAVVALRTFGTGGRDERIVGLAGVEESFLESYAAHYHTTNPYNSLIHTAPVGRLVPDRELVAREIVAKGAFFNEWMKPQGIDGGGILLNVARNSRSVLALSLDMADSGIAAMNNGLTDVLKQIMLPLERATTLAQRVMTESVTGATGAVIATMSVGAIAVDKNGRVVNANDAAERLFRRGFLFLDRARRLRGITPHAEATIQHLLGAALAPRARLSTARLKDFGTDGEILLTAVPMARNVDTVRQWALIPVEDAPVAIVYLATEAQSRIEIMKRLEELFDMSPNEARLAHGVYQGVRMDVLAAKLDLSEAEAMACFAAAMRKIGVEREVDLVRRVGHLSYMTG
ncbi:hypothetical protein L1787_19710 [Acuticoccus sp. M5D2P5]|uniref:hypothetical protein n=1 Tax=Acuticoccus kalidii TaxID=2910977 RepID=UPI001F1F6A37|nr:hypothetical protein [Acuticoccus kalidii]MCF3935624.1 hypothetical protein [Acuticoccus kalidii]